MVCTADVTIIYDEKNGVDRDTALDAWVRRWMHWTEGRAVFGGDDM